MSRQRVRQSSLNESFVGTAGEEVHARRLGLFAAGCLVHVFSCCVSVPFLFGVGTPLGILNAFIYTWLSLMFVFNYWHVMSVSPGFVEPTGLTEQSGFFIDNKKLGPKFCQVCKLWQPPRVHHCVTCNKCVHRMEQHCYIIGNCVGLSNVAYFYIAMVYELIGAVYLFLATLLFVLNTNKEHFFEGGLMAGLLSKAAYAVVGLSSLFLAFVMHIWSVMGPLPSVSLLIASVNLIFSLVYCLPKIITISTGASGVEWSCQVVDYIAIAEDAWLPVPWNFYCETLSNNLKGILGANYIERLLLPVKGTPLTDGFNYSANKRALRFLESKLGAMQINQTGACTKTLFTL
eukprot:Platyproteum_vivax@DN4503_c0_g1_i1.p1